MGLEGEDVFLWVVKSIGLVTPWDAATWSTTLLFSPAQPSPLAPGDFDPACAHWSVVDVDGDGKDELVGFESHAVRLDCESDRAAVVTFDPRTCTPSIRAFRTGTNPAAHTVKLLRMNQRDPPLIWALGSDRLTLRAIEATGIGRLIGQVELPDLLAAAPIHLGEVEAVVAAASGQLLLLRLAAEGGFAPPERIGALPANEEVTSLAADDVNGDGLLDVVVLTRANSYIFAGSERGEP